MVKCTGRGLVVKRPGVLNKVQMLNLVLGVGVFFPSSKNSEEDKRATTNVQNGLFFSFYFFLFSFRLFELKQ